LKVQMMLRAAVALVCVSLCVPPPLASAWPDVAFEPAVSYPLGSPPEAVAIGDVTSDGRMDVLVTTGAFFDQPDRWTLFVFAQTAAGDIELAQKIPLGTFSDRFSVAVADLTQDGANDAVVATQLGVQVFEQADGRLRPGTVLDGSPAPAVYLRVFDEESDGALDLAVVVRDAIHVLRRTPGSTGYQDVLVANGLPEDFATGDLNGDGRPDIAAAFANTFVTHLQQPDGTYLARTRPARSGMRPFAVEVADVAGDDGREDLLVTGGDIANPGDVLDVYPQQPDGELAGDPVVHTGHAAPYAMETGQIDPTPTEDVAVVERSSRAVGVQLQEPPGMLAPVARITTPKTDNTNADSLALGDFDSDGLTDMAVADSREYGLVLLRQVGGAYPRPRSAKRLQVSLVPAFRECAAPDRVHGPPLGFGSCEPHQRSPELTVGTPDANGFPADMIGSARFSSLAGNPATPANEADVAIDTSILGPRRRATRFDYTGQLLVTADVRITDRGGASRPGEHVTVEDVPLSVTVPCIDTDETARGSECSIMATFNALMPGAVVEGNRAIWQVGAVEVHDGGPDGNVRTEPNDVFATQGVFVP
jgi:hypothetical protein